MVEEPPGVSTRVPDESPTNNDSIAGPGNDEIAAKAVTFNGTDGHPWKNSRRKPHSTNSSIKKPQGNERLLTTVAKRRQEPVRGLPTVDTDRRSASDKPPRESIY